MKCIVIRSLTHDTPKMPGDSLFVYLIDVYGHTQKYFV